MEYRSSFFLFLIFSFSFAGCKAQKIYGENYLQLKKVVSLTGVKGRIDHMDIDLKNHIVYVSAPGSNEVVVVDNRRITLPDIL